ncbi:MAG: L,D-transpeptidase [Solirubrobacterales bacterium]
MSALTAGALAAEPGAVEPAPDSTTRPVAEIANRPSKGFTYARMRDGHSVAVSRRPGGRPYKRLPAYTEMGSRRHLAVVRVRPDWVAVAPTMKRNGHSVWIRRDDVNITFVRTMYSVRVDLSRRQLALKDGTRVIRRLPVAIGRPGSSTPTGRFAVTDKLNGFSLSSYYGCCVLALNGHQPNLPAGWSGGNRLAIHGTSDPGSIGTAASAGCVRARDRDLRVLMRLLPPGAPVFIRH